MTVSQESPAGGAAGGTILPENSPVEGRKEKRQARSLRNIVDSRTFRPEVQGLRALAVLMVASYHIWFGRVSGGVDIFLLISAFLLTLSFLRKAENGKPLGLRHYWTHMFKRLLPAVVVVILGILVATRLFVPESRWSDILGQAWASILYYQNWLLAFQSVDYYAQDHSQASPLQHFWSLSIQGQVFILWPILFALSALIAKLCKVTFRSVAWKVFAVVFVGSLVFSIHETYTNQGFAYFDTRARLWEFAFGTLMAFIVPYISLPKIVKVIAGWVGLAAMLSGGFILDVQGQFPGYVALWPLVAAALIIMAGDTGSKFGVDRLLSAKPLTRMGDLSYALYLWHWPVLVIYLIWRGRDAVGIVGGTGVLALSLVLSYLTVKFVERPMRSMKWGDKSRSRSLVIIVVSMALVATPVLTWQSSIKKELKALEAQLDALGSSDNPGAISLYPGFVSTARADAPVIPANAVVTEDWFNTDGPCVGDDIPSSELLKTACGYSGNLDNPAKTIVVVGNSHAQQWTTPLAKIVKDKKWKIITLYKGGCRFGDPALAGQGVDCNKWNEEALGYILETKPDYVYTTATMSIPSAGQDAVPPGFASYANRITANGTEIIGIRDNPRFNFNMIKCIEEKGAKDPACAPSRDTSMNTTPPVAQLEKDIPGIHFFDMTDQICTNTACPPVIGNVNVYMDDNHITESYMKTLTPIYEKRFEALGLEK
jgi:peptidoglycan/LPS O-acetylase OafA/YrhL